MRWEERYAPVVEKLGEDASWFLGPLAIDIRYATRFDPMDPKARPPHLDLWIRADGAVPADPILQRCLVAYASDMTLIDVAGMPHGMDAFATGFQLASLDHAMWYHRDFRADRVAALFPGEPDHLGRAQASRRGRLFTRSGEARGIGRSGRVCCVPEKPASDRS